MVGVACDIEIFYIYCFLLPGGTCGVEIYYINSFLLHGGTCDIEVYYVLYSIFLWYRNILYSSFLLHTCGVDILYYVKLLAGVVGCDGVADHKSMQPCLYQQLVNCPMKFCNSRLGTS